MTFEIDAKENNAMTLSTYEVSILADNQTAHDFAGKYIQAVNGEFYARGLKLESATHKFTEFLRLQAVPPWYEKFMNAAFSVLVSLQPELFLVKFLGEKEETVKAALALSSALGNKTAKVIAGVQRVKELGDKAEKIKDAIEKAKKVKEAVDRLVEANDAPGAKDIARLDASKAVVDGLIQCSQRAAKIWWDVIQVLDQEFPLRLSDPKHPAKESLLQLAQRLLQPPPPFTTDELQQIENLYLYEMIKAYVKSDVTVSVRKRATYGSDIDITINNLNNNQQATIVEYFGPKAKRGKLFPNPPVFDIHVQLKVWGAKETIYVDQYMPYGMLR